MAVGLIAITSPFWVVSIMKTTESSVLILSDNKQRVAGIQWALEQERIADTAGQSYYNSQATTAFSLLQEQKYELVYISAIESGLETEQLNHFKNYLVYEGGNAVIEHSIFDLATAQPIRYELETLANIQWTGWKGIAYTPQTISELPAWLYSLYEKRYGESWLPTGAGVVLVNAFNDDVLVLQDEDFSDSAKAISVEGKAGTHAALALEQYADWFTIFEAADQTEEAASFKLNVSPAGMDKLTKRKLPASFPAVVDHHTAQYRLQTLAGEFSKLNTSTTAFNSALQRLLKRDLEKAEETKPYYSIFRPLFTQMLHEPFERFNSKSTLSYIDGPEYSYNTRSREGEQFIEIYENGEWVPFIVKGVNLGMGKPGYFPGEAAITEAEYFRWFKQIGAMNANVLRVYTLQSPAFYKALYEYNLIAEAPLYFFHGAWVIEEFIAKHENMFVDEVTEPFYAEIRHIVDAVYGDTSIEKELGHAYGEYTVDVSDYLLGWIIGIEFSGETVLHTNQKNSGMKQYDGQYVQTLDADPFEIWLAESMDYTINYEIENYEKAHLISFTNWPTTDLLTHPKELDEKEDLDKIDPNLIHTKQSFIPGQFYSFHIYPYYPDFIDEAYSNYVDKSGKANAYAGYLNDLKQYLTLPSIVTEFGIPASRGITHSGQLNRNQGGHSEDSQGKHVSSLYEDILNEGYGGGLVFTWQDEWFKRTWNTMDLDNPDRRPYWSNYQTNEQYFGLLAFEAGQYESAIHVDGETNDWEVLHKEPVYLNEASDGLQKLYIHHDARYLYVRLDYNKLDVEHINTRIYFDTLSGQGIKDMTNTPYSYEDGFEFVLDIKSLDEVELFVDSYYDTFQYLYGETLRLIDSKDYIKQKNNGIYHPIKLILSREYKGETESGELLHRPYEEAITGKLLRGNSHPKSEHFNSIADYYVNESEGIIELRLTWLSLNFMDPSLMEVVSDLYADGTTSIKGQNIEGITVAAVQQHQGSVVTLPQLSEVTHKDDLQLYSWLSWDHPLYYERLKKSYYVLQHTFASSE